MKTVPSAIGVKLMQKNLLSWENHPGYEYIQFGAMGCISVRYEEKWGARQWHTSFNPGKPARKILCAYQAMIGGSWIAFVDPDNTRALNACKRGGMVDFGVHLINNNPVHVLIKTYS